jgi:hypothetical protein
MDSTDWSETNSVWKSGHFRYLQAHSGWIDPPCLTPPNAANMFRVKRCLQPGGIRMGKSGEGVWMNTTRSDFLTASEAAATGHIAHAQDHGHDHGHQTVP